MKSCLYLCCYLHGNDMLGDSYLERHKKFFAYYRQPEVKDAIGFSEFVVNDNGNGELLTEIEAPDVRILRNEDHIPRGFAQANDYKYGWRSIWQMQLIMGDYDKIILLDADAFILTKRLAHWIRDLDKGWVSLWTYRHNYADTPWILTRDAYPHYLSYIAGRSLEDFIKTEVGKCMEQRIPFTHSEKSFKSERFGENIQAQTPDMDYYGQARLETPFVFEMML